MALPLTETQGVSGAAWTPIVIDVGEKVSWRHNTKARYWAACLWHN